LYQININLINILNLIGYNLLVILQWGFVQILIQLDFEHNKTMIYTNSMKFNVSLDT
jgi:hypothetical protein